MYVETFSWALFQEVGETGTLPTVVHHLQTLGLNYARLSLQVVQTIQPARVGSIID